MQHRDNSKEDIVPIEPAEFTFGGEESSQRKNTTTPGSFYQSENKPYWPALLGVIMLSALVGVFWVLPKMVESPKRATYQAVVSDADSQPPEEKVQASPYSDAEIMQQRREVQKILLGILALNEDLKERQVEKWAFEEFYKAEDLALEADEVYRKRNFMAALEKYKESLQALEYIKESIPERLEQHISEGNRALNHGEMDSASDAFRLVLTISTNHPRGLKGKDRAEKLPLSWWHFTQGSQKFIAGALNQSREQLKKSISIDPETFIAHNLLAKVEEAITERDYQSAMSSGYSAIAEQKFETAKVYFHKAQKLKPIAKAPRIGLIQAKNGADRIKIDKLLQQARFQETEEDWHKALESYTNLVKKDASLVAAVTGKARATARAKLDDQLQDLLQDPLTLSEGKRNHFARKVLTDARKLSEETPRLQQQIEKLEGALTQALIPLPVRFKSDRSTSVTIYHVGKLGNFDQREIALKPGRYIAVGTRQGYRDVRQEFIVKPGTSIPEVVIRCAEKINGVNNS
ncbi:hypothetical protein MO867_02585 [Microbulbifer sp. OS29]|uniref:Tetratricopeptide repeat-containing protein n=1 Tax=Microbulbifer okhotskensis TaxID=2926617 RepID=A0A9X2EP88_9GAMM|nr:hypothetical protein [Microbulbifer okhotskensis]MCO1333218.1 hypothetical protein [Microbulbifer okhotskensis]